MSKLAVAVEQGRAQLQRVTYANNGQSTIEALSSWQRINAIKPSLGMLMFHVRAANAYAKEGAADKATAAMRQACAMVQS